MIAEDLRAYRTQKFRESGGAPSAPRFALAASAGARRFAVRGAPLRIALRCARRFTG
jgi:hypothetical protein